LSRAEKTGREIIFIIKRPVFGTIFGGIKNGREDGFGSEEKEAPLLEVGS
jgi:hypothetical protein